MRKTMALLWVATALLVAGGCNTATRDNGINNPVPESHFNEEQQYYIHLSRSLYIIHFSIDGDLSDMDKAGFFKFILSTEAYTEKLKTWEYQEDSAVYYKIPLSDIEKAIFAHLDTQTFDPLAGFAGQNCPGLHQWYDSQNKIYITTSIGGYGGAAALGVLDCQKEESQLKILLGVYNMEKFYVDPPEYELLKLYETVFLLPEDGTRNFKIIGAGERDVSSYTAKVQ